MRKAALLLLLAVTLSGCGWISRIRGAIVDTTVSAPEYSLFTSAASSAETPRQAAKRPLQRTMPPTAARTPAATAPSSPERQALLDAFREIAFTSEYPADAEAPGQIRKWAGPVRLAIHGSPTAEDRSALRRAMDGLNALDGFPGISAVTENPNADMWFVKLDEMDDVIPGYVGGNWGFFTVNFEAGRLTDAAIAIATDVTDQDARTHLIFEELLQSTGLMQDSPTYPDSIFFGEWTTTPEPSEMDWELLRMLYMPSILPGMSEDEAMDTLRAKYLD